MSTYGIITTAKQSLEQTLAFVRYHLIGGADHLFLFLDDPEDPARPTLEAMARVSCIVCDPGHWQAIYGRQPRNHPEKQHANMELGAKLARERNLEWAISLDADELLYSENGIRGELDELGSELSLYKLEPLEAIHTSLETPDTPFCTDRYKVLPRGLGEPVSRWAYRRVASVTRQSFFGHTQGKTFFRLDAPVDLYRQHRPKSTTHDLSIATSESSWILHHDCMSLQDWKRKWQRRIFGTTAATNISDERRLQHERIRDAMNRGDEAVRALFQEWFVASKFRLSLLGLFGLVRRIPMDPRLFEDPEGAGNTPLTEDAPQCGLAELEESKNASR